MLWACHQTSLTSNMLGGASHGVDLPKMAIVVHRVACQLCEALTWILMMLSVTQRQLQSVADRGFASRLNGSGVAGAGHELSTGGTNEESPRALVAGVHDSLHTLVPYGEAEEEDDLPDDDVAFCLRSMFAEPGGLVDSVGQARPSTNVGVAPSRELTDETYARELDSKLEKKEIDAVIEDPLGLAARKPASKLSLRITNGRGR